MPEAFISDVVSYCTSYHVIMSFFPIQSNPIQLNPIQLNPTHAISLFWYWHLRGCCSAASQNNVPHSHSQNHSAVSSACIPLSHRILPLLCLVLSTFVFTITQLVFKGYYGCHGTSTGRRHVGKLLTIWYSVLAGEFSCRHVLLLDMFLCDVMLGFSVQAAEMRTLCTLLYSTLFRCVIDMILPLDIIGSDSSYVCSSFTHLLILIPSDPPVLPSSLLRSILASRDFCLPRDWKPSLT